MVFVTEGSLEGFWVVLEKFIFAGFGSCFDFVSAVFFFVFVEVDISPVQLGHDLRAEADAEGWLALFSRGVENWFEILDVFCEVTG